MEFGTMLSWGLLRAAAAAPVMSVQWNLFLCMLRLPFISMSEFVTALIMPQGSWLKCRCSACSLCMESPLLSGCTGWHVAVTLKR